MATQPKNQPTSANAQQPAQAARPAYPLSQRTVSGLEHDITALVKELEQLGLAVTVGARK